MRPYEVAHGNQRTLALRLSTPPAPSVLNTEARPLSKGSAWRVGEHLWSASPLTPRDKRLLEDMGEAGDILAHVVQADVSPPVARLVMRLFSLAPSVQPDPLDIGLLEGDMDSVRRSLRPRQMSAADVLTFLTDEFVIETPGDARGDAALLVRSDEAGGERGYQVYGRRYVAEVYEGQTGRLLLRQMRLGGGDREDERRPYRMVRCPVIRFIDAEACAPAADAIRTLSESPGYLKIWESYHKADLYRTLGTARRVGAFRYHRADPEGGVYRFALHTSNGKRDQERWDALQEADPESTVLEATAELPEHLELERSDAFLLLDAPPTGDRPTRSWSGVVTRANWAECTIEIAARDGLPPPEPGFLSWSIRGDRTRIDRRRKALGRLNEAGLPSRLRFFLNDLETGKRPAPLDVVPRGIGGGAVVTRAVDRVFGEAGPRPRQREAIDVALRTPDIAIIQGPPGTGKTRVITAIQARLAELAEDPVEGSRQILLTGYQHDAVENVVRETTGKDVGLLAYKVGRRSGDEQKLSDAAEGFRSEVLDHLRELAAPGPADALIEFCSAVLRAVQDDALSPADVSAAMDHIAAEGAGVLDAASRHALDRSRRDVEALLTEGDPDDEYRRDTLALVPDALQAMKEAQWPRLRRFVRRASHNLEAGEKDALFDQIRQQTLTEAAVQTIRGLQAAMEAERSPDHDAVRLDVMASCADAVEGALDELERQESDRVTPAEAVLRDYIHELEHHPSAFAEALATYSTSLAATCSQAGGHWLDNANGSDGFTFDTVIVDEAARANPLDLLIPMVMARRRVILVGDHKQLPQMLEPEVEAESQKYEGETHEARKAVRQRSLFELLFAYAERRQAKDRITRCVTLNEQFRMHPALGAFVSNTFYPGVGLESPRPASDFAHGLRGYGKACAAWIHVGDRVPEKKRWERAGEADVLVAELKRLMGLSRSAKLTYGVVTFYSAQVRALRASLKRQGIVTAEGIVEEEYAGSVAGRDRLAVGTVDAFQGRQFDVVLLSTVRSNSARAPRNEVEARRKYGFLTFENRLNVAMSRQQRLLIVVGDGEMFSSEAARTHVPGLHTFYGLATSSRGVYKDA